MPDQSIPISFPLDSDGFLRRQCPYCGRHFKVRCEAEEASKMKEAPVDLFCPYCGQSADPDSWWTDEQRRYIEEVARSKVVEPLLQKFSRDLKRLETKGKFISVSVKSPRLPRTVPHVPEEPNDMKVVVCGSCGQEIKTLENWEELLFCVRCGSKIKLSSK